MRILMVLGHDVLLPYEDGRVMKEARTLTKLGHEVTILCWSPLTPRIESHNGITVRRVGHFRYPKALLPRLVLKTAGIFSSCRASLREEFDCVHCHDFETLPGGILSGVIKKKPVVYDAHELEIGRERRAWLRRPIRLLEEMLIKRCETVIAANPERLRLMGELYDLRRQRTCVIRNYSDAREYGDPPEQGLEDLDRAYVWLSLVGNFGSSRPYRPFIEALAGNPHIRILYFGQDGLRAKEIARSAGVDRQVIDRGLVSRRSLLSAQKRLDGTIVAFAMYPENYTYCESNRAFDALCCGCLVVATRNPSLLFLEGMSVGFNVVPGVSEISAVYRTMDRSTVEDFKRRISSLVDRFSWEANEETIAWVYGDHAAN